MIFTVAKGMITCRAGRDQMIFTVAKGMIFATAAGVPIA